MHILLDIASWEFCKIRKENLTFLLGSFMMDFHGIKVVKILLVAITQVAVGPYQLHDSLVSQTISEFGVDKPEGRECTFETC